MPQPESMELTREELRAARRELYQRSLIEFAKEFWHVNEPGRPLEWNWHLDAVCEHLEAVSRGEIRRLVVNIPPRTSKSSFVSVLWPSWVWAGDPGHQFLCVSHGSDVATRDTRKMRNVVTSREFQELWGRKVTLAGDQNQKTRFENTKRGHRISYGMTSSFTGEGGDTIIIDDPIDRDSAKSEVERQAAIETLDEKISTRLNDPAASSIVMVMQRLHAEDPTGHVLEQGGWEHLMIPMRYEPGHPHRSRTSLGWTDPRTGDAELLWPERFTPEAVERWEKTLGIYGTAGQLQQRPAPRGGGLFLVDRFGLIDESRLPTEYDAVCRGWDKAATSLDTADYSVGVLMAKKGTRFFVLHVARGQWSPAKVEAMIDHYAEQDQLEFGERVRIRIEREGGAAGKTVEELTTRRLQGKNIRFELARGSKEDRAEPFAIAVENHQVLVAKSAWTKAFLDEHATFPLGRHDDQVDAAGIAYRELVSPVRRLRFATNTSSTGTSSLGPQKCTNEWCHMYPPPGRETCCDLCAPGDGRHTPECYEHSRKVFNSLPEIPDPYDGERKIVIHDPDRSAWGYARH